MDRRRYLQSLGSATALLVVAGCTDDEDPTTTDSTPTGTSDPGSDETPTSSPTETATETATGTPTGTPPPNPDQRVAVGDGLQFDPEGFDVAVGDTVLWEWLGGGHNVKFDDGDVPDGTSWTGTAGDRTTTYGEGHRHWHTFEVAGEYDYYCVPHQTSGMRGEFTVRE